MILPQMKIQQIRLGFCTNSSSSHSIVWGVKNKINDCLDHLWEKDHYGWEEFVLASEKEKMQYFAAILKSNLVSLIGEDYARAVIIDLLNSELALEKYKLSTNMGIDHQSRLTLPAEYEQQNMGHDKNPHNLSILFIKDFIEFLKRKDVVILGGNDNTDAFFADEFLSQNDGQYWQWWEFLSYVECGNLLTKKDGDWWILYNKKTGARAKLSFKDNLTQTEKATTPYSVDMKITDKCSVGCSYCYQDSRNDGQHASINAIERIGGMLEDLEVFEVALGGGNPLCHPNICNIITILSCYIPNIHLTIHHSNFEEIGNNKKLLKTIKNNITKIAVSVSTKYDIHKIFLEANKYKLSDKIQFHHIIGSVDQKTLECLLAYNSTVTHCPIVLLGYKNTGRGDQFVSHKIKNLLQILEKTARCSKVSFDTLLAKEYREKLEENPGKIFVQFEEGLTSCYIDAVRKTMSKDSYSPDNLKHDISNKQSLSETWKQI